MKTPLPQPQNPLAKPPRVNNFRAEQGRPPDMPFSRKSPEAAASRIVANRPARAVPTAVKKPNPRP